MEDLFDAYRTIYAIVSSRDEKFIAVGDNFGRISVLSTDNWEKCSVYQTSLKCIYQMISFESDGLVASGTNGIEFLRLLPEGKIELIKKICNDDMNTSVIANKKLYSGGAKGKLLVHDLSGSLLCEIEPHSEAIQCLSVSEERNMLASCGEDGLINIWDLSSEDCTPIKILKPFQHPLTKRKEKYLSSLSFKGDWIIAGGGPATALWHIGAEEPAQILESDNTVPFIILQADTRILLGGSDGSIHQFKNNGKQISTVATGSDIIYSLAESPSGMLYCGGNRNTIDVYKHYGYRTNQIIL